MSGLLAPGSAAAGPHQRDLDLGAQDRPGVRETSMLYVCSCPAVSGFCESSTRARRSPVLAASLGSRWEEDLIEPMRP